MKLALINEVEYKDATTFQDRTNLGGQYQNNSVNDTSHLANQKKKSKAKEPCRDSVSGKGFSQ